MPGGASDLTRAAAKGAGAGSIIPGVGTLAGAGIGLALGVGSRIFGRRRRRSDPLQEDRQRILADIFGRLEETEGPASSTATFTTGAATIRDELGRVREADAQGAAARGLTGSSFEVAQGGERNRSLVEALRGLLGDAERTQIAERGQLLSLASNLVGQGSSLAARQQAAADQRRAGRTNAIMQTLGIAAQAYLGGGG